MKVILAKVPPWGKDWPKIGTTMDVTEGVARDLISGSFAVYPPILPETMKPELVKVPARKVGK